jgi:hypothetical protein
LVAIWGGILSQRRPRVGIPCWLPFSSLRNLSEISNFSFWDPRVVKTVHHFQKSNCPSFIPQIPKHDPNARVRFSFDVHLTVSGNRGATDFISSEHLLLFPNIFIGTVDEIYKIMSRLCGRFLRKFVGGPSLFQEFQSKIRNFLDSTSDKWARKSLKIAFEEGKIVKKLRTFQPSMGISVHFRVF